jgi:hypothetical protein
MDRATIVREIHGKHFITQGGCLYKHRHQGIDRVFPLFQIALISCDRLRGDFLSYFKFMIRARDRYRMAEATCGFGEGLCDGPSRAGSRRDAPGFIEA